MKLVKLTGGSDKCDIWINPKRVNFVEKSVRQGYTDISFDDDTYLCVEGEPAAIVEKLSGNCGNDPIDIAFKKLLKALDMEWATDENAGFRVELWPEMGEIRCVDANGDPVDDRGALFAAVRSLMCMIFPNLGCRNDQYIVDFEDYLMTKLACKDRN